MKRSVNNNPTSAGCYAAGVVYQQLGAAVKKDVTFKR